MAIKRDYLLRSGDGSFILEEYDPKEFRSERAALTAAKDHLQTSSADEVWVYRLSHVVSRPEPVEVVVDEVP